MNRASILLFPFLLGCCFSASVFPQEAIDVGSRRELFVDRLLIDEIKGARLELHHPRPAEVALKLDRPWEGGLSGYFTVLKDADQFRMYYRGRPVTTHRDASSAAREVACYAESDDGITWTRPELGLHEVGGTTANNVILVEPVAATHNFAPFLDKRPGVPEAQRYKAVGGTRESGLIAFVSSDGIHWERFLEEPIIKEGAFDSQNNIFWSEHENSYICYFRTFKDGIRWITRTTSPDFIHWSDPVDMSFGDAPAEHLYTNQTEPYYRAPHVYFGLAARFWPGRQALTETQVREIRLEDPTNYEGLKSGCSDSVLLTSRGGYRYDRLFLESIERPGLDPRDWVARSNYPARGILQTGPGEMSIYVQRHYGQPSAYVERMTFRIDGMTSLYGPYSGGELLTKPLVFDGSKLSINFSTSAAGSVRIEIQDSNRKPIPGFRAEEAREIIGDQLDRIVAWDAGTDLRELSGKRVRLRFILKDAHVYSFQFLP